MGERTAIVTGACGFIGRHAARALRRRGFSVVGIGNGSWAASSWAAWGLSTWHPAEVTLASLLAAGVQPELLIHCAGSSSVGFSMEHPVEDFHRTVHSTLAVLEFARLHAPAARIAFASSGSVHGSVIGPISEDAPDRPLSPYSTHKLIADRLCMEYGQLFNVSSAVVRLFSVYGPGLRKQLLWDACTRLQKADSTFAGSGKEVRDWIHVDDAVELLITAGEQSSTQVPVISGGSGVGATVEELISELAGALGHHAPLHFTGVPRPGNPDRLVADITRARLMGWAPRVGWREGAREYAQWFRQEVAVAG
jgi:UDP-glucose 4-epimerase